MSRHQFNKCERCKKISTPNASKICKYCNALQKKDLAVIREQMTLLTIEEQIKVNEFFNKK